MTNMFDSRPEWLRMADPKGKPQGMFITIPCEPDNKKGIEPIYVFLGNDDTGAARCEYKCPYCGMTGPRRSPMEKHMGLVMNVPAGCKVLIAQDEKRRSER